MGILKYVSGLPTVEASTEQRLPLPVASHYVATSNDLSLAPQMPSSPHLHRVHSSRKSLRTQYGYSSYIQGMVTAGPVGCARHRVGRGSDHSASCRVFTRFFLGCDFACGSGSYCPLAPAHDHFASLPTDFWLSSRYFSFCLREPDLISFACTSSQ